MRRSSPRGRRSAPSTRRSLERALGAPSARPRRRRRPPATPTSPSARRCATRHLTGVATTSTAATPMPRRSGDAAVQPIDGTSMDVAERASLAGASAERHFLRLVRATAGPGSTASARGRRPKAVPPSRARAGTTAAPATRSAPRASSATCSLSSRRAPRRYPSACRSSRRRDAPSTARSVRRLLSVRPVKRARRSSAQAGRLSCVESGP